MTDQQWTVWEFIQALGGQAHVAAHYGLGRAAVNVWCRDGVIPGYLIASITEFAADQGVPAPPAGFFRLTRKPGSGKRAKVDADSAA